VNRSLVEEPTTYVVSSTTLALLAELIPAPRIRVDIRLGTE